MTRAQNRALPPCAPNRRTILTASLAAAVTFAGHGAQAQAGFDFLPVLRTLGSFRILEQIINTRAVRAALGTPGGVTVLAPTDQAFARLPNDQLSSLLLPQNAERLQQVMLHHILPGRLTTELYRGQMIKVQSISGFPIIVNLQSQPATANGLPMVLRDANFSNGAIQVLDGILT